MSAPDIDGWLAAYLEQRQRQRADARERVLASLTDRERRLVREAAVMGFVRGSIFGGDHRAPEIPQDPVIVAEILDGCRDFPDLYPLLGGSS